jgi:hypothetical protein
MTPDEESSQSGESSVPAKRPRARRSRRGGRGRGRKPAPLAGETSARTESAEPAKFAEPEESVAEPLHEEAPLPDSAIEEARHEAAEASLSEQREERQYSEERSLPSRPERRDFKPAPPPAIAEAITLVTHILSSLKRVLDEMEEVLETLELAEVQKNADEREIQSLLYALRQFERRGPEPRQEQQGGPPRDSRPQGREPRRHGRR